MSGKTLSLLEEIEAFGLQLLGEAKGDTLNPAPEGPGEVITFKDRCGLLRDLTSFMKVKHRIEDESESGETGFERWRRAKEGEASGGRGGSRTRSTSRAKRAGRGSPGSPGDGSSGIEGIGGIIDTGGIDGGDAARGGAAGLDPVATDDGAAGLHRSGLNGHDPADHGLA